MAGAKVLVELNQQERAEFGKTQSPAALEDLEVLLPLI
jgi:hypothetical protein